MIEWIPGAMHQWFLVAKRRMGPLDYTAEWQRFRCAYCQTQTLAPITQEETRCPNLSLR